ncbi:MAG: CapA family protein [Faecalibacillus faecis]
MRNNVNLFLFIIMWVLKDNIKPMRIRSLAKFTIDAGADAVIGSHPHVVQGTETYNGNLLFIH